jgi:hypothetical protein
MKKAFLVLVLAYCGSSWAQAYKWVDEKGKVHYGDRPPTQDTKAVMGTRNAPAPKAGNPVDPGMTVAEVKKILGEPDHVRVITTAAGQSELWTYAPGKNRSNTLQLKFEGGKVSEVASDSAARSATAAPAAAPAPAPAAAPAAPSRAAAQPDPAIAERERQQKEKAAACDRLNEELRNTDNAARQGGSAATMDSLRQRRQRIMGDLSSKGC